MLLVFKVTVFLICHLVESKPTNGNGLNSGESLFSAVNQFSYICELSPYSDEGSFFRPNDSERSIIIDGEPGIKLHLIIRLINARTCQPLRDVYVHIWHANTKGEYSPGRFGDEKETLFDIRSNPKALSVDGEKETNESLDELRMYQSTDNFMDGNDRMNSTKTILKSKINNLLSHSSNSKESKLKLHLKKKSVMPDAIKSPVFLRGYQISNYAGEVTFITVLPGWYPGRAQHIHIEVHSDKSKPMYIGQLFFNKPAITYYLPAWKEYANNKGTVDNQDDPIYKWFEGERTTFELAQIGDNLQGIITLGVDPEKAKIFD